MISGMWGKKIGMTQIFSDDKVVPVSVIDLGNWLITGFKNKNRDGYDAVQVGHVKKRYRGQKFSAERLKDLKRYFSFVREIKLTDAPVDIKIGQPVNFEAIIAIGDRVDVFGKTRGRGFAGVIKRHGFGGPPGSHGSTMGRRPGSIGFFTSQGKVIKGKKMPGHMGNQQRAMKNLDIVKVEKENNVILIKGSVPGHSGSLIFLSKV